MAATTPAQQAQQSTNSGIGGGIVAAAGSVLSSVVDNLFNAGDKRKRREFEQALALLTNQQQQNLNLALLQANTDTDRMAILTNAVLAIKQQQLAKTGNSSKVWIVIAATVVLLITAIVIKKI